MPYDLIVMGKGLCDLYWNKNCVELAPIPCPYTDTACKATCPFLTITEKSITFSCMHNKLSFDITFTSGDK